jgi:hypothetical protein
MTQSDVMSYISLWWIIPTYISYWILGFNDDNGELNSRRILQLIILGVFFGPIMCAILLVMWCEYTLEKIKTKTQDEQ